MDEKFLIITTFVLIVFVFGTYVFMADRMKAIENKQEAIKVEVNDLKKKQNLTSNDVDFLEHLIIEGKTLKN